jgi:hypothetical protein
VLCENGHNDTGFGRDISMNVFNEEQEVQLKKLRDEAEKIATGK